MELSYEWVALVGACAGVVRAGRGGLWDVVDRWLERRWIDRTAGRARRRRRTVVQVART